jgi:hypothetical protein
MHYTELSEKIKGYGLKSQLNARLGIVVRGGVSRNMIYKAMSKGPITPLAKIILQQAEILVSDHETEMSDKLFQMECETAT